MIYFSLNFYQTKRRHVTWYKILQCLSVLCLWYFCYNDYLYFFIYIFYGYVCAAYNFCMCLLTNKIRTRVFYGLEVMGYFVNHEKVIKSMTKIFHLPFLRASNHCTILFWCGYSQWREICPVSVWGVQWRLPNLDNLESEREMSYLLIQQSQQLWLASRQVSWWYPLLDIGTVVSTLAGLQILQDL